MSKNTGSKKCFKTALFDLVFTNALLYVVKTEKLDIYFLDVLNVFSSKCVTGREKSTEEPKILCGRLARGSVFCEMVEKAKNDKSKAHCFSARKPLNYQQVGDLPLKIMLKEKKHGDIVVKSKKFFKSKSSEAFFNTEVSDDIQRTLVNILF